jgi:hypothetical protein
MMQIHEFNQEVLLYHFDHLDGFDDSMYTEDMFDVSQSKKREMVRKKKKSN